MIGTKSSMVALSWLVASPAVSSEGTKIKNAKIHIPGPNLKIFISLLLSMVRRANQKPIKYKELNTCMTLPALEDGLSQVQMPCTNHHIRESVEP